MKKHENQKSNRKWVIKAMIGFIAVLAVLTFFSNTIMNMTIPLVVTSTAMRGNLAYTNSATGTVVADGQIEIKGLEGRTVSEVSVSNYDTVQEGDVIMTLVPVEDLHELTELENQLLTAQRTQEYNARTPHHTDYTTQNNAIRTAQQALADAQSTLNAATNRDETIAAAQQILNANQAAVVALQAQVASASASVENINAQLAACYARLAVLDGTAQAVIPTTTGMYAPRNIPLTVFKSDPTDPIDPTETASDESSFSTDPVNDVADPADSTTTTVPTDTTPAASAATESSVPTESTSATTQAPAPTDPPENRDAILAQIAQLQGQLTDAQNRLAGYSSQLAAAQLAVTSAQSAISTAQALPSTYAAEEAVVVAQEALDSATIALSDAQINAGIEADKRQDAVEDGERTIANLEEQIERVRARLLQNEITAPADGVIVNLAATSGDKLQESVVICTVVPSETTYSVNFTFPTNIAQNLNVGQELNSDNYYYISRIVISSIKPDPNNPRDNRIVKCALYSDSGLWPGESITVTADRGNATYDHVVAASAISEDNSGTFVYVVDQSSGPLGDRYVVRRVTVSVEARSGAFAAISGEGLDNVMVVTRSDVPLHNGDRVRLEDYSSSQS